MYFLTVESMEMNEQTKHPMWQKNRKISVVTINKLLIEDFIGKLKIYITFICSQKTWLDKWE